MTVRNVSDIITIKEITIIFLRVKNSYMMRQSFKLEFQEFTNIFANFNNLPPDLHSDLVLYLNVIYTMDWTYTIKN